MIMARNEDGTYSQVGFVKDNAGIDTEYIYDKDGDIVFEKGFTRETSGTVPLTINGIGKDLKAWSITGNTVQNGTPTPENPVEIQAVGDRTANLFDNSLLEQGGWKATAGTIPTKLLPSETNYTHRTRYNQIIPLLASTLSLYCPANIKINYVWIDANGISLGGSGYQKNGDTATAPEQAVSMTFILGLDSDIECTPSDFSDINLVAGSIAPESYEPYGYKIPVVTRGKNLFDKENASPKAVTNQGVFVSNSSYISSNYISVSPNTTYTKIPIIKSSQFHDLCEYDENKIFIRHIFTANNGTFTTSEKTKYIVFNIAKFNIDIAQLEKGSTATPYEPYHEPITTPIYLPTPLYSGEVLRSDGSREVKWGKIVLTGEEKITFVGTAGTSYRYDFVNIKTISQIKYARKNSKITHFEQCDMPTIDVVGYDWHGASFYLIIITTQSTINKFKDWLKSQYEAGTPVTVWYQLATPTTETVTVPQIPTLNGTTVIDVDTAVKPTEMYAKYKSSK